MRQIAAAGTMMLAAGSGLNAELGKPQEAFFCLFAGSACRMRRHRK
jgi:hypothetical protein